MKNFQNIAKSMAKRYAKILFKKLLVKFLIATSKIWVPALLIFIFAVLGYFLVYELPKQAILGIFDENDRDAAFEYGEKNGADVMQHYPEVAARWNEGLSEEQLSQVDQYELDWAWLAAVDRVLGDPEISGTRDPKELVLIPEETFELVRPTFEWEKYPNESVTASCVVEDDEDETDDEELEGDTANSERKTRIETSQTSGFNVLLKKAVTIHGTYIYEYTQETKESTADSECGTLVSTYTSYVLSGIRAYDNDYEPLRKVMKDYGIVSERDQNDLIEYWNEFLSDPDGSDHDPLPGDWVPVEGELMWPLDIGAGRISSRFGYRTHPITGDRKLHAGVDIAAPKGTKVYAVEGGKVVHAGTLGNAGLAIILDHGDLETRYYHLSQVDVRKGVSVTRGDNIGKVGSTGASTGPHLHFEIRIADEPVDPLLYYTEGGYAE